MVPQIQLEKQMTDRGAGVGVGGKENPGRMLGVCRKNILLRCLQLEFQSPNTRFNIPELLAHDHDFLVQVGIDLRKTINGGCECSKALFNLNYVFALFRKTLSHFGQNGLGS